VRNSEWAAYIDDTWKIAPHLTITAGLRWEVAQPMLDVSGRGLNVQLNDSLANVANVADMSKHPVLVRTGTNGNFYEGVDFRYQAYYAAQGQTVPGSPAFQVARDGRLGSRMVATDYNNFAPRLGIAWSPTSQWSVRTGFGIFYSQESKNSIFDLNRGLGGRTGRTPDNTYARGIFSIVLAQGGDPAAGVAQAERVLAEAPDDGTTRYNAACTFTYAGDHERAMQLRRDMVRTHPGFPRDWPRHDPGMATGRRPRYGLVQARDASSR